MVKQFFNGCDIELLCQLLVFFELFLWMFECQKVLWNWWNVCCCCINFFYVIVECLLYRYFWNIDMYFGGGQLFECRMVFVKIYVIEQVLGSQMVQQQFKVFYLLFESGNNDWQIVVVFYCFLGGCEFFKQVGSVCLSVNGKYQVVQFEYIEFVFQY